MMTALDTNVVVRVLTRDDREQSERAARLLAAGPVEVAKSVLVETEYVLRGAYAFPREQINNALRLFVGLAGVEIEDRSAILMALEWHAQGMDFADAVHLASASRASAFATFDRSLGKLARKLGTRPAVRVPGH